MFISISYLKTICLNLWLIIILNSLLKSVNLSSINKNSIIFSTNMHILGIYHSTNHCLNSRDLTMSKPVNKTCNLKVSYTTVDKEME